MKQDTQRAFHMVMKEKHQWGNKPGKGLTKALQEKKIASFISKMKDEKGDMVHSSLEMASIHTIVSFIEGGSVRKQYGRAKEKRR